MPEAHYLAGLDLRDRRVVVVGGGAVAQRRLPRLVASGAAVEVVAPEVTTVVSGMADAGELSWHRRRYADGDVADAWYALACTDDGDVNAAVVADAERHRVFCVRADSGPDGSAVTPATGDHDGLLVGVLSGGEPQRSATVRDGLLEALRDGTVADGAGAERTTTPGSGVVVIVGGGPGDPDLITVAGRRWLARADVVVCDRLAPRELLDELRPDVDVVDAAKIPYGRSASQDVINEALIDNAADGKVVVRLKGGDPYVFGRGYEEVLACAAAGIDVVVVPGISSAFAAPALADVPVTHRGVTHEVVVVSGHVAPGHDDSLVDWPALARMRGTIVLMMGVQRLGEIAAALLDGGRPAETPVGIIADGSTHRQRVVRTTLAAAADTVTAEQIQPPAIIVIGPVAGLPDRVAAAEDAGAAAADADLKQAVDRAGTPGSPGSTARA